MRLLFVSIFSLVANSLFAQSIFLEVRSGYSTYDMEKLRRIKDGFNIGVPVMYQAGQGLRRDFPGTAPIGISAGYGFKKVEVGVDYTWYQTSTKIRWHGQLPFGAESDYMYYDQFIRANTFGVNLSWIFIDTEKISVNFLARFSTYFSKVKTDADSHDEYSAYDYKSRYYSESLAVTPMLGATYKWAPLYSVGVRAGYCWDGSDYIHPKSDKGGRVTGWNSENVDTNWSGIRTEIFFKYILNKK